MTHTLTVPARLRRALLAVAVIIAVMTIGLMSPAPAHAATETINGTIASTAPTYHIPQRNGEMSTCAEPKAFAYQEDASFGYVAYPLTATPGTCVTVSIATNDINADIAAYSVFDPTDPSSGYLADPGVSAGHISMSFKVPPSGQFTVVVAAVIDYGDFTLTISDVFQPSTTTLQASPTTPAPDAPVTFTAHVDGVPNHATPTGHVAFYLDSSTTAAATTTLDSSGDAAYTTSFPDGTHTVTATYVGDDNYTTSTSPAASVTVVPSDTTPPVSTATASPGTLPRWQPLVTTTGTATVRNTRGTVLGTVPMSCWNTRGVTVHLSATDADSGVASLSYSATGAQRIPQTTVTDQPVTVSVTAPGRTALSYSATDKAGNAETAQTTTLVNGLSLIEPYACALSASPSFTMPAHGIITMTRTIVVRHRQIPLPLIIVY